MNKEISYARAVSEAWNQFMDEKGLVFSDMHTEHGDKIGRAFMAGWITGIGSIRNE